MSSQIFDAFGGEATGVVFSGGAVFFPARGSGDGAAGKDDLESQTPLFRPVTFPEGDIDFEEPFGFVDLFTMGAFSAGSGLLSLGWI